MLLHYFDLFDVLNTALARFGGIPLCSGAPYIKGRRDSRDADSAPPPLMPFTVFWIVECWVVYCIVGWSLCVCSTL